MNIDPNFNIELALAEAGIPLSVFEPYKQRLGHIARCEYLKKPLDKSWLASNREAEELYPKIAELASMHTLWIESERARVKQERG